MLDTHEGIDKIGGLRGPVLGNRQERGWSTDVFSISDACRPKEQESTWSSGRDWLQVQSTEVGLAVCVAGFLLSKHTYSLGKGHSPRGHIVPLPPSIPFMKHQGLYLLTCLGCRPEQAVCKVDSW